MKAAKRKKIQKTAKIAYGIFAYIVVLFLFFFSALKILSFYGLLRIGFLTPFLQN